jgi:hypothetical protein
MNKCETLKSDTNVFITPITERNDSSLPNEWQNKRNLVTTGLQWLRNVVLLFYDG